jgi:cytochrome c2
VASKATSEALWSFIKDPHRYQPATLMPQFRFTDDEVRDIVAYALEEWTDPKTGPAATEPGEPAPGDVAAGREVFIRRGCYGCHPLPELQGLPKIGPKQAGLGDRVVDMTFLERQGIGSSLPNWVFTKLSAPETMARAARMPTFGFSPDQAGALTVALLSLRARELPRDRVTSDPPIARYDPQGAFGALVRRYRCLSCHSVGGYGGTLSTVAFDRIGSQLGRAHIESFVRSPFAIRVGLSVRMPRFNLSADEARLIAGHLTTVFVDDALEAAPPASAESAARGRALFERLGCRACHIVGERGGYVGPDLNGAGLRLKPGWIKAWLLAPERWRPGTLEPDHGLSDAQAEDLSAFVMTLRRPPTLGGAR